MFCNGGASGATNEDFEQVIPIVSNATSRTAATTEPAWIKVGLIALSLGFLGLFLVVPLTAVFVEALRKGFGAYFGSFRDPAAFAAIRLTLLVAAVAVPANLV